MLDWYETSEATTDVFSRPSVAPQGQDGVAHFNYYDQERSLSFQWDGHLEQHVTVSYGGYGEPVKWTFALADEWSMKNGFGDVVGAPTPVFLQGREFSSSLSHFQRACDNWVSRMEDSYDDVSDNELPLFRIIFDKTNPNWNSNYEVNEIFLKTLETHMNKLLEARGHVFLNEVYDALSTFRTSDGAIVGWYKEEDSKPIKFHRHAGARNSSAADHGAIRLTFDVDGVIYKKI